MTFKQVGDKYADDSLLISVYPHDVTESVVKGSWATSATTATPLNGTGQVSRIYQVTFTGTSTDVKFDIKIAGEYKFYLQHFPSEFGIEDAKFIKGPSGSFLSAVSHSGHNHGDSGASTLQFQAGAFVALSVFALMYL